jgi:hypothetical protein
MFNTTYCSDQEASARLRELVLMAIASALPQCRVDVQGIHENHAPTPHAGDLLPSQPLSTGVFGWEPEFGGEVLDGSPATTLR